MREGDNVNDEIDRAARHARARDKSQPCSAVAIAAASSPLVRSIACIISRKTLRPAGSVVVPT